MSGLDALSEAAAARNEPLPVAEPASQAAGSKRPRAARRTKLQMAQDKVKKLQTSLEKLEEEKNKQKAASAAAANDSAAQITADLKFKTADEKVAKLTPELAAAQAKLDGIQDDINIKEAAVAVAAAHAEVTGPMSEDALRWVVRRRVSMNYLFDNKSDRNVNLWDVIHAELLEDSC